MGDVTTDPPSWLDLLIVLNNSASCGLGVDRAGNDRQGSTGGANLAPVKRADILLRHCNIHLRIRWGEVNGKKD